MANKRILIVEDESIVALDLAISLKKLGYIILDVVDSGKEAVKKAETFQPDLILMDIILKGDMDGIETTSQIRARFDIPVIYLTAFGDESTLERAKITEPFGYILKPFKERELTIAIEVVLYKHEMDTKMRKMERWLAITLRSIGDAVITTDTGGHMTFMNHAAETLTGWKQEGALKKNLTDVLIIKELEKLDLVESLKTTIKEDSVIDLNSDYSVLVTQEGTEIPVAGSFAPIRDENGTVSGVVIVLRDITERKKAEKMRLENRRLEEVNKAKSEFLATMSHELRTPLNASIGFSELLIQGMGGELNEKQKQFMDYVLTSNQFLLTLINDILDLSKIEAGKIELVIEKMSVPVTIKETLPLIKEKASKNNVLLKAEFDPELEFIEADKQRFKQILFNLLSNAVKFCNEGSNVTITSKKEGYMAMFSVSDTGIGIKEENVGRLFQKFEQLDSGISRKYGGTGLGLAITEQLVKLHGGKIWAESKFGEGSTFTFSLPIEAKKEGFK